MTAELSPTLVEYFAATNAHDVEAMIAPFAEESVVEDEGRQRRGLVAIRDWMKETIEKYDFKVDPIESTRRARKTAVLVSVSGRFPGSPINLRYEFTVDGGKIARLEIR
jgi:hypothetical protein